MAFPFLAIAGALGSILGKSGGSKSDQRMQEGALIGQNNRTAADLYSTQQGAEMQRGGLDLQRKGFTEDARGGRAKQALIADLLSNMKDVNVSVPGIQNATVTGGLRPSAIGETGRASMAELAKQALLAQMTGDTFEGGTVLPKPAMQGMPQASGLEKFLNIAGLVGSGLGGVGAAMGDSDDAPMSSRSPDVGPSMSLAEILKMGKQQPLG